MSDVCGNGSTAGSSTTAGSSGDTTDGGSGSSGGSSGGKSGSSSGSGTTGAAGAGGGAGGGGGNGSCEGEVSDDASCWATDELGVFVSSEHGDDATADGTKDFPYKTLAKGISSANGKNIYVCVGTDDYAERVSLDHPASEVRIYGGFECETWTYDTARRAQVISPSNIALRLQSITAGVYIENMEFVAADGSGSDASSYGAFITDSKNVTFKRVKLSAGKGLKGADGVNGADGSGGAQAGSGPVGTDALCEPFMPDPPSVSGGKWNVETACGSQGGAGATALKNTSNGPPGNAGSPTEHVTPLSDIENGGLGESATNTDLDGKVGTQGAPGSVGDAAGDQGRFSASGFSTADGKAGNDGFPGQGGGGGGSSKGKATCYGASGGAGGMGGCGASPGGAGKGGGASVGLFSWASSVSLQSCAIQAAGGGAGGSGGRGGGGGNGGPGGAGGGGNQALAIADGGMGGKGGPGGNGGSGSGGTGGPSFALVYGKQRPIYDAADTSLTPDKGGDAGEGGQVLNAKAPDGFEGASEPELEVE